MSRPTTIPEYIETMPEAGRPHLRQVYALLQSVAPEADEAIKWGAPFFVEPRFLFSFAGFSRHLSFVPSQDVLDAFREEAEAAGYATTKKFLKVRYDQPVPEALLRRMAERQLADVTARETDSFW